MKILAIDPAGAALDWYLRCQEDGHEVRVYMTPGKRTEHIGDGLITKVPQFHSHMRWADMVFLADNTKHLKEIDSYRARGVLVCGPTYESAEWELDRGRGVEIFEECGIKTIPSETFSSYDKAIEYVKKKDVRLVSKPSGDADKALSYVSKSPEDMVYMLERWKKNNKLKGDFILQEFKPGIEMAVGGWIGPGGFNRGWCENFEFKKLMNDDLGVACFDETTEVLTEEGWKFWPLVDEKDKFCSLRGGKIVFDPPSQVVIADFDGELLGWESKTVNVLVTPNHNMYVQDDHARKEFFFEQARETENKKRLILRTGGDWTGRSVIDDLPRFYGGSAAAWSALLGAYIGDGHCKDRSVVFGNCPEHKQQALKDIALAAGFEAKMYGRDLYINSAALCSYLKPFGKSYEKFAPDYILEGDREVIGAFFDGFALCDGSTRPSCQILTTTSKLLADQLQEMALKLGFSATINARDRRGDAHFIGEYECVNRRISYDVSIAREKEKATLCPEISYRQKHSGKIYCVTVPSHIIYVRRGGKACWIGQTGEQGTVMRNVKSSKLADKVLAPCEEALLEAGHIGYVDVNCIIDEAGVPWPMEFTMRPGYPCFPIQQALHKGDHATWLKELAEGVEADPLVYDTIATGVVLSIPDYPYSHLTSKDVMGIPIYGLKSDLPNNIHFAEVMQGTAPMKTPQGIKTKPCIVTAGDYVLVTTGTGKTVTESAKGAYQVLKSLMIPNSPMYRTDIGTRLKKQLPSLQKLGYATSLEYGTTAKPST